jgi:hypothetical protein
MSREAMINLLGGFFPEYYLQSNEDIRNVIGTDQQNAWRHYLEHGIDEERRPNPFFDPKFYREFHSDISTMNGKQLLDHWIKHGIMEGRRGTEDFWTSFYLSIHRDLVLAFDHDLSAAFAHWKTHGNAEARLTAPSRSLRLYYRKCGDAHEIVVKTGIQGIDSDSFKIFGDSGGQIAYEDGILIGSYSDAPGFGAVSGIRIGYGLDRVALRISKEITGHFCHQIGRSPIDHVLVECLDNMPATSESRPPRITFPNFEIRETNRSAVVQ